MPSNWCPTWVARPAHRVRRLGARRAHCQRLPHPPSTAGRLVSVISSSSCRRRRHSGVRSEISAIFWRRARLVRGRPDGGRQWLTKPLTRARCDTVAPGPERAHHQSDGKRIGAKRRRLRKPVFIKLQICATRAMRQPLTALAGADHTPRKKKAVGLPTHGGTAKAISHAMPVTR